MPFCCTQRKKISVIYRATDAPLHPHPEHKKRRRRKPGKNLPHLYRCNIQAISTLGKPTAVHQKHKTLHFKPLPPSGRSSLSFLQKILPLPGFIQQIMYNIYFDKRVLTVCPEQENLQYDPNAVIYHYGENSMLSRLPGFLDKSPNIKMLCIPVAPDKIENTFKQICSQYNQINAGGGLVMNDRGEYLLIFRNGIWDLPKGKQEPNEDIRETALREVEEECGMTRLEIRELICVTHHCYHQHGNFILKHTYWYKMIHTGYCTPKPQLEENIQKCIWVKKEDLPRYLSDTYPSILEVFRSHRD